jgi:hypothetical protein
VADSGNLGEQATCGKFYQTAFVEFIDVSEADGKVDVWKSTENLLCQEGQHLNDMHILQAGIRIRRDTQHTIRIGFKILSRDQF